MSGWSSRAGSAILPLKQIERPEVRQIMAALTVVAKVVAKGDAIVSLKAELLKLMTPTRQENGCLEYRLHQDNQDPSVFLFYETWESPACLEQHMNSPHFKAYLAAVDGMVVEKVVQTLTSIE